jgi:hypothetical protein
MKKLFIVLFGVGVLGFTSCNGGGDGTRDTGETRQERQEDMGVEGEDRTGTHDGMGREGMQGDTAAHGQQQEGYGAEEQHEQGAHDGAGAREHQNDAY